MTNKYTEFSVVIYPDTWISLETLHFAIPTDEEMENNDWYFYISAEEHGLWLHGEDVNGALEFIQELMEKHNAPTSLGIYVSWANTCSKPRHNEFYGGGAVVTTNTIFNTYSSDVISKACASGIIHIKY